MASVSLAAVTRAFPGGACAVDDLSLDVHDGELLVLVGPSGCGKTTTLRLIAGLDRPDRGSISIGDRPVDSLPPRDRDVAMVFQGDSMYPHLNVRRNLAFALQLRAAGPVRRAAAWFAGGKRQAAVQAQQAEIDRRVADVADLLAITDLLDRRPAELSGGQRQRVALGRALARQPAVYLFDEPLSHLDAGLRAEMRREIRALQRRLGTTMIYVTHDQAEAMSLGDRIALLDRGRLQQLGPPLDLYRRPQNRFVAGFLGTPPMNFLGGVLAPHESRLVFRATGLILPVDSRVGEGVQQHLGRPLVLGVRPEDVELTDDMSAEATSSGTGTSGESPPSGSDNRGRVAAIETLGESTLVSVDFDGHQTRLVARRWGSWTGAVGDALRVVVPPARVHFFDAATGQRLAPLE